ncbi:unnamed protein product [Cyclocybe aegerita]|uniref:Uncharacterized protein n=1 Tax=Cyclocybe aegerita TaxID=1973307 RepID=A0A8S0WI86_CYCAE|nr:unnamed protein product [Cyclocybe aegerita]
MYRVQRQVELRPQHIHLPLTATPLLSSCPTRLLPLAHSLWDTMSSNFSPTPAELTLVSQIFTQADPQKLGVLTGDVAVRVLTGAKLPPVTLGEIWNISDEENKGWLPKRGVAIAVRLIGWAQKGEKITQALVNKPGPLAVIEGINTVAQQNTGISLPKSPPPAAFPPLTAQDKAKFQNMFLKAGPTNGLLGGEKARDIFVKSKLSNEQLMKIWNLADTQDRGALDSADFAMGMYLIQGIMTGKITFIPTTLPPGLYQQAGGLTNAGSVRSHMTGNSGSFSPVGSSFPSQHTGQTPMLQPDHTGLSGPFRAPTLPARPNALVKSNGHREEWDVTPTEKASSDRYFDSLDTHKRGFIEGEVAVPFMLKSQLPGEVLAQIWDLADINNDGRLTRDGFAIAMHLIQKKLAGQDIPQTLPLSLMPPTSRPSALGPSPFSPLHTQTQQHPEPVDLFSFDDTPPPSAVPSRPSETVVIPQTTGSTSNALPQPRAIENDPFSGPTFQISLHRDFLSDDDGHDTVSPPLHDHSAEIGNVKNQLHSTERSVSTAKTERSALESTLASQASQLSTLQTQLSSAKAAYETEVSLLATLKERHSTQTTEIQKTREELIRAESDLSAIRVEKAEIEGTFLRDKEEARDLHRRMIEAGQQAEAIRADVEKLKKEAKQQKGLLAIARKQLSTKENERTKAEKEHEEATAEVKSLTEETKAVEAEIANLASSPAPTDATILSTSDSLTFAAAQPLPTTPDPSGPIRSNSNNPFERLVMASGPQNVRSPSPFFAQTNEFSSPPASINGTVSPPSKAEEDWFEAPKEVVATATSTTSDQHDAGASSGAPESVLSPMTDHFVTPPTSARNQSSPVLSPDVATKFPSLDDIPPPAIPSVDKVPPGTHAETDLSSQLKEIDIEESDSDSDDDVVLAKLAPATVVQDAPAVSNGVSVPSDQKDPTQPKEPAVSFDDIFGSHEPEAQVANGKSMASEFATKGSEPFEATATFKVADEPTPVAGVDEFDAALGKLPSSAVATNTSFTFDAAFDDNFDFTTAKAADFPPAPVKEVVLQKKDNSNFDDVFGISPPAASGPSVEQVSNNQAAAPTVPKFETSFEEAFAGFDSVTEPKLEVKPTFQAPVPTSSTKSTDQSIPGSFPSSPVASPRAVASPSRVTDVRASSPSPRERTPPPRVASPKPRVSSSSSKEAHEKPKDPPPRHSKLSIRLPFGKKKKHQEPLPAQPSQHLTPPVEESRRLGTPHDDDVEAVKQLTAMGFSRSQAVDALEKYGYDVPRALNSLLGAQ